MLMAQPSPLQTLKGHEISTENRGESLPESDLHTARATALGAYGTHTANIELSHANIDAKLVGDGFIWTSQAI